MAVELPAPGFRRGRRAHHGQVVLPLAVLLEVVVVQLAERLVQPHDVARLLQPARAQRGAQQRDAGFTLRRRQLLEADPLADVEVLVHPLPPLVVVHRRTPSCRAARRRARRETPRPLSVTGAVETPGGLDAEEVRHDLPAGGHALERLGQPLPFARPASAPLRSIPGSPREGRSHREDAPGFRRTASRQFSQDASGLRIWDDTPHDLYTPRTWKTGPDLPAGRPRLLPRELFARAGGQAEFEIRRRPGRHERAVQLQHRPARAHAARGRDAAEDPAARGQRGRNAVAADRAGDGGFGRRRSPADAARRRRSPRPACASGG